MGPSITVAFFLESRQPAWHSQEVRRNEEGCTPSVPPPTGSFHSTSYCSRAHGCSQPGFELLGLWDQGLSRTCLLPGDWPLPLLLRCALLPAFSYAQPTWAIEIHRFDHVELRPWRVRPLLGLPTLGLLTYGARPSQGLSSLRKSSDRSGHPRSFTNLAFSHPSYCLRPCPCACCFKGFAPQTSLSCLPPGF
jgi:hypothetical protein